MGRKRDLTRGEKNRIVNLLGQKMTTLDISKELQRDHRTIKKAVHDVTKERTRSKGKGFKNIGAKDMRKLKMILHKNPLLSSQEIFQMAGLNGVKRDKRCRILRELGEIKKSSSRPPLNNTHKEKRLLWARQNMKTDFSKVIFTDESRVTLDGPDGWSKGWVLNNRSVPGRLRRQQGGGGVMIWAGIVGSEIIGPFKVEEGVKLNSDNYCELLNAEFFPWYRSQSRVFKRDSIFMHDNAPSHASKVTTEFLAKKGFSGKKLMVWPSSSPDLNPIENMWALLKKEMYKGGKQYKSKGDVWEAIQAGIKNISPETVKALTNSMDQRLIKVVENKGNYINM